MPEVRICALVTLVTLLAACGGDSASEGTEDTGADVTEDAVVQDTATTPDTTLADAADTTLADTADTAVADTLSPDITDTGPAPDATDTTVDTPEDVAVDTVEDVAPDTADAADTDTADDATSDTADAASDATTACSLDASGPVASTAPGEVIENLHIIVDGQDGVRVTHDDVVLRNLFVEHRGGEGIVVTSDRVRVENVHVVHTGAPASGANDSAERVNIRCQGGAELTVERARLVRGSSGIYLVGCDDSVLRAVEGHDFRGPFPRGQVVQWNDSHDGLLEHFSVENPPGSWPEDSVNAYESQNVTIRDGLVDGNNAPSGVGVIFDRDSTGLVEDVDAVRMGNGCFSAYAGGADATFRRTRCRETICESQDGRGEPRSGSLVWAGNPELTGAHTIEDSVYDALCTPNLVWPAESFATVDIRDEAFTPRDPLRLDFCWE